MNRSRDTTPNGGRARIARGPERRGPVARGRLAATLVAAAAVLATGCGATGSAARSGHADARSANRAATGAQRASADPVLARLGLPPVPAGSVLPGYLLIADRENNRIIVVSPDRRIVWRFPRGPGPVRGGPFMGPDDAFLTPGGANVITNEEFSDTVALISLTRKPRILWRYGHQDAQGAAPGYLAHPDDAYLLPNGRISVADIINCRVLRLDRARRIVRSIGSAGDCEHDPPRALKEPNGDTPLPDGGVLVTEIGGWVDRFDGRGRLVWSVRTPTDYPSDAQLLPEGNVLVAGFNAPGRIDIIEPRTGRVIWSYGPRGGHGELDRPSLALALPNGMIAVTDDWHHRVLLIDRATKRIVWQYGHDGVAGSAPGYLDKPDGLDLLPAGALPWVP
jgi:DNA-binding beta-propeller fold protein YncE